MRLSDAKEKRAAISGDASDQIGDARARLTELVSRGAVLVEVSHPGHSAVLELPPSSVLDDLTSVVVVRVEAGGQYGTTRITDTAMLEAAARRDAGPDAVVILRVADATPLEQIVGVTAALQRAGIGHVVLGLLPPRVAPPSEGWEVCPFPRDYGIEAAAEGSATIAIEWDAGGRAGAVKVLESSGRGFGAAAALCALWQLPSTSRCSKQPPCTQKLLVHFTP